MKEKCGNLDHRPAAVAPIWLLAWETPYAEGTALKKKKKKIMHIDIMAILFIIAKDWK